MRDLDGASRWPLRKDMLSRSGYWSVETLAQVFDNNFEGATRRLTRGAICP